MESKIIEQLACEVASKIEPKKGYGGESYWIRLSKEIIEKIVEDYCIVKKSKLKEKFDEVKTFRFSEYYRGRYQVLKELFGSLFEEEK